MKKIKLGKIITRELLIVFGIFMLCIIVRWTVGDPLAEQGDCWRNGPSTSYLDSGEYIDTSTMKCFIAEKIIFYSVTAALYLPLAYLFIRFIIWTIRRAKEKKK